MGIALEAIERLCRERFGAERRSKPTRRDIAKEEIGMRISLFALLFAGALIVISGLSFAIDVGNCADGTQYGKCSAKFPGQYCTGNIASPTLGALLTACPCSKFPGYVQQGDGDTATCIAAKCTDGTDSGACSATKPKQCANGALIDNSTACGCPAGKRVAPDKIFCEFIPCNDSGVTVPEGTCSPKKAKMCVNGQLVNKSSVCKCPTGQNVTGETCTLFCSDGTEDTKCSSTKPKKCTNGYLLDDAAACGCPEGLNPVGKQCSAAAIGDLGGADLLGGTGGSGNESSGGLGGANALSCCCLPTALIGIVGGFVFFRKRN